MVIDMQIFIQFFQANLIYIIVAIAMYLFDTISGFAKVIYKKNYESNKARKAFSKLLVFICLIFAVMGIDILIKISYPESTIHFCNVICIAISLVELTSIGENMEVITGKNYVTTILDFIKITIKKMVDSAIGKEDEL